MFVRFLPFSCVLPLSAVLFAESPRITSIAPVSSTYMANLQLMDADSDGDLDLISSPLPFTLGTGFLWMENLGDGVFSASKHYHIPFKFSLPYSYNNFFAHDPDEDGFVEIGNSSPTGEIRYSNVIHAIFAASPFETGLQSHFVQGDENLFGYEPVRLDEVNQVTLFTVGGRDFDLYRVDAAGRLTRWGNQSWDIPAEAFAESGDRFEQVQAADLDGDGDLDLILNYEHGTAIFERTGESTFSEEALWFSDPLQTIADLDRDGDLDLVGSSSWLRDEGGFVFESVTHTEGYFEDPIDGPHPLNRGLINISIEEGEINVSHRQVDADGQIESSFDQTLSHPVWRSLTDQYGGIYIKEIIMEDFDGDDEDDLVIVSGSVDENFLTIFRWTGTSYELTAESSRTEALDYFHHVAADFDEDGDVDVLIGPGNQGSGSLLLNDGSGNFQASQSAPNFYPSSLSPDDYQIRALQVVKFDNDDHWDLSLSYVSRDYPFYWNSQFIEEIACVIIKGNGDGTFQTPVLPEGAFTIAQKGFCDLDEFVDWDGDGDLDATVEGGWRENIDGELDDRMRPLLANMTQSIDFDPVGQTIRRPGHAVGDIDGDGSPDYIALYAREAEEQPPLAPGEPVHTDIGIAFNNGQGGIDAVVYVPISIRQITDALGNPISDAIPNPYVLDLDQDGRDEIIYIDQISQDSNVNVTGIHYLRVVPDPSTPRDFSSGFQQPLDEEDLAGPTRADFNGDGTVTFASYNRFVEATSGGPRVSRVYDFIGDYQIDFFFGYLRPGAIADFDGDGDADTLFANGFCNLNLVRNLIVDERSAITAALLREGLTGLQATPTSDADDDGLSNAEELLRGTDPLVPDAEDALDLDPQIQRLGNEVEVSFRRRTDRAVSDFQLHYILEGSADLENWTPLSLEHSQAVREDPVWEIRKVTIPPDSDFTYFRTFPRHEPAGR